MINFLRYKKIYFFFSGILILASLISLAIFGLKLGIDFTGGSILEVEYLKERPSEEEIKKKLAEFDLGEISLQLTGQKGVLLRMKEIDENLYQKIVQKLGEVEQRRFESIGPVIGRELRDKTKILIALSFLAIVFYIALAFRRIQRPLSSWQYGIVSLFTLFFNILIPLGIFSVLGKFYEVQITIAVIIAFLTILGYSINNTVVVFDRIRENLLKRTGITYEEILNQSLNQTLTRQINTSLTTLFVLGAIFLFGGETLKYFALALILGILAGTYSSIFLASPILASWPNWQKRLTKGLKSG